MSMSIYAMNYSNGSVQNKENGTRTLTQTTNEEDIKMAELQQGMGSTRLTRGDVRQDGTVSLVQRMQGTEAYRQIQSGQTEQQFSEEMIGERKQMESVRMDKAEISEEGRIANAKMQQQINEAEGTKGQTQEKESDNSNIEYETEDLSEYTDTELEQMYYQGKITRQEYEDETGKVIE